MIKVEKDFLFYKGGIYSFVNPQSLSVISKEMGPNELDMFVFFSDGFLLCFFYKWFKGKDVKRYSFDDTSLAPIVFRFFEQEKSRVAIVGGRQNNIEKAREIISSRYPMLSTVDCYHGYYDAKNLGSLLVKLKSYDLVVAGMGGGNQEKFLLKLKKIGWEGTGFTCGGYFDQLVSAQGENYYPDLFDRLNLRWVYRLIKEPRRMLFRYFLLYPWSLLVNFRKLL